MVEKNFDYVGDNFTDEAKKLNMAKLKKINLW